MIKSNIININIIVDTTRLMDDFPEPSVIQTEPTVIPSGYQYIVVSDNLSLSGQGSGNLTFQSKRGNTIRFYACSEYNNFTFPVIIYGLHKVSGLNLFKFSDFKLQNFSNAKTIVPTNFSPLDTTFVSQNFWFAQNIILKNGKESFALQIAVFDSHNKLFGFFEFEADIVCE